MMMINFISAGHFHNLNSPATGTVTRDPVSVGNTLLRAPAMPLPPVTARQATQLQHHQLIASEHLHHQLRLILAREPCESEMHGVINHIESLYYSDPLHLPLVASEKGSRLVCQLSQAAVAWLMAEPFTPAGYVDLVMTLGAHNALSSGLESALRLRGQILYQKLRQYPSPDPLLRWLACFPQADAALLQASALQQHRLESCIMRWQQLCDESVLATSPCLVEQLRALMNFELPHFVAQHVELVQKETNSLLCQKVPAAKWSSAAALCFVYQHLSGRSGQQQLAWLKDRAAEKMLLAGIDAASRQICLRQELAGPGWLETLRLMSGLNHARASEKRLQHSRLLPLLVPSLSSEQCSTICHVVADNLPEHAKGDVFALAQYLRSKLACGSNPDNLVKKLFARLHADAAETQIIYTTKTAAQGPVTGNRQLLASAVLELLLMLNNSLLNSLHPPSFSARPDIVPNAMNDTNLPAYLRRKLTRERLRHQGQRALDIHQRQYQENLRMQTAMQNDQPTAQEQAERQLAGVRLDAARAARVDVPDAITNRPYQAGMHQALKNIITVLDETKSGFTRSHNSAAPQQAEGVRSTGINPAAQPLIIGVATAASAVWQAAPEMPQAAELATMLPIADHRSAQRRSPLKTLVIAGGTFTAFAGGWWWKGTKVPAMASAAISDQPEDSQYFSHDAHAIRLAPQPLTGIKHTPGQDAISAAWADSGRTKLTQFIQRTGGRLISFPGWQAAGIITDFPQVLSDYKCIVAETFDHRGSRLWSIYIDIPKKKKDIPAADTYFAQILSDISVFIVSHYPDNKDNPAIDNTLMVRNGIRYPSSQSYNAEKSPLYVIFSANDGLIKDVSWRQMDKSAIPSWLLPPVLTKNDLASKISLFSLKKDFSGARKQLNNIEHEYLYHYVNLQDERYYLLAVNESSRALYFSNNPAALTDPQRANYPNEPYFTPWSWKMMVQSSAEKHAAWLELLNTMQSELSTDDNSLPVSRYAAAYAAVIVRQVRISASGDDISDIKSFVMNLISKKNGREVSPNQIVVIKTYRKSIYRMSYNIVTEMTLWDYIKQGVNSNGYYNNDLIIKRHYGRSISTETIDFIHSLTEENIRQQYDRQLEEHYSVAKTEMAEKMWLDQLISTTLITILSGTIMMPASMGREESEHYQNEASNIYLGKTALSLLMHKGIYADQAFILRGREPDEFLFCPCNGLSAVKIIINSKHEVDDTVIDLLQNYFPPDSLQKKRVARYNFYVASERIGDSFFIVTDDNPLQQLYLAHLSLKKSLAHFLFKNQQQINQQEAANILASLTPFIMATTVLVTGGIAAIPDLLELEGTALVMTERGLGVAIASINFNAGVLASYPEYMRSESDADRPVEAQRHYDNFVWGVAINTAMQNPLFDGALLREEKLEQLIAIRKHHIQTETSSVEPSGSQPENSQNIHDPAPAQRPHIPPVFNNIAPLHPHYDFTPAIGPVKKYSETGVFEDIAGQKFIFYAGAPHAVRNEGDKWWIHPVPNDDVNIRVRRITGKNSWERQPQGLQGGGAAQVKELMPAEDLQHVPPLAEPELPFTDPLEEPEHLLLLAREALGRQTGSPAKLVDLGSLERFFLQFWGHEDYQRIKEAFAKHSWFAHSIELTDLWQEMLDLELMKAAYIYRHLSELITQPLPVVSPVTAAWSIQLENAVEWIHGTSNTLNAPGADDHLNGKSLIRRILHKYILQDSKDIPLDSRDALLRLRAQLMIPLSGVKRLFNDAPYGTAATGEKMLEIFIAWMKGAGAEQAPLPKALRFLGAMINCHSFEDGNGRLARTVYAINLLREDKFVAPAAADETLLHGLKSDWHRDLQQWLWH